MYISYLCETIRLDASVAIDRFHFIVSQFNYYEIVQNVYIEVYRCYFSHF